MKDSDAGVRHHVLEALARLGNRDAKQELAFMTNAGIGAEEVFAVSALAASGDPTYVETFRYKLANAAHLETRLAAARGLGLLRSDEGLETAIQGLRMTKPPNHDPEDPIEGQLLRTRQLAAAALGAIGRPEVIPRLASLLERNRDPRVQVSAARAILDILARQRSEREPFATFRRFDVSTFRRFDTRINGPTVGAVCAG
jgi:HEAT repeat protein